MCLILKKFESLYQILNCTCLLFHTDQSKTFSNKDWGGFEAAKIWSLRTYKDQ